MTFRAWLFPKLLSPKDVATETSRRSCFRTPFGNQRVNGFQTPLKVPRQHYYPFFPWIPRKLSWEKTALLWSKILRLFANTFTADDKYSCHNMQNFWQQFQTLLCQKWKTLSGFFFHFWNVHEIYNFFKKRMSVLAWLFPILLFPKEVATETSRRSFFRTPFGNQRVNGYQTPLKVARHHYYPFFEWISGKLSWKKTALLWSKILRLFANTFTADYKYSCRNMQNFRQQFQTLLSQKRKTLSGYILHFRNVHQIYNILKKTMRVLA